MAAVSWLLSVHALSSPTSLNRKSPISILTEHHSSSNERMLRHCGTSLSECMRRVESSLHAHDPSSEPD